MRRITMGITIVMLFAGCASTQAPTGLLAREATESGIQGCDFLGTVTGHGLPWGSYNRGRNKAIRKLAAETDSRGGTHFVITRVDDTRSGIEATGRAYRCDNEREEEP